MRKYKFMNYTNADGEISLLMYGDIDSWGINAKDVVTTLCELESQYKKINLRINSPGGSVFEGLAIYNAIKNSKADIEIYVDGIAASMASVIALCGRKVYMSKYAQLMIHCVIGGAYGNTKEIENILEEMKSLENTIVKMYADKTGMSEDDIKSKYMDGQDHWISASDALDLGFIDGIYDTDEEPKDKLDTSDKVFQYFQAKLQTLINKNDMIEKIKSIPQFANCADETAVIARIKELTAKASEAETLRADIEKMKEAEQEKTVGEILAKGIECHKLTQEMSDNLKQAYKNNPEGLKDLVDAMPEKLSASAVIVTNSNASDDICKKTWDELDKSGDLAILKAKYPDVFKAKFEEKFGKKD